jgi:hypothetical protein
MCVCAITSDLLMEVRSGLRFWKDELEMRR